MNSMHLSRRRLLKGLGTTIALPFLEAMVPAYSFTGAGSAPPKRAAFLFMPNGVHPDKWTPKGEGSAFELSPILKPLLPLQSDVLVLTNLMNKNSDTHEDGHYTKTANFLTSMRIEKTTGSQINSGGVSVDQLIARQSSQKTLFPSLVYGIDRITTGVDKNVGFTRLYGSAISWKSPTIPNSKEINPRMAFDRMFRNFVPGKASRPENPWKKSVIDAVMDDAQSLEKRLGVEDQNKLAEYLEAVRSVEQRIESQEMLKDFEDHITPQIRRELIHLDGRISAFELAEYRSGVDVTEKVRLMLDLIVLAFWSDASRVATFMFGNSVSNRNFSFIEGVQGNHHSISHHKNDPRQLFQYEYINLWHIQQYAYLLNRLKSIPEGDGTLLDHSMILFGSGLRDGNRHSPFNLPIVLAGRGGGRLNTGRHLVFEQETPLANLYRTMLSVMDAPIPHFGDSTAELNALYA